MTCNDVQPSSSSSKILPPVINCLFRLLTTLSQGHFRKIKYNYDISIHNDIPNKFIVENIMKPIKYTR